MKSPIKKRTGESVPIKKRMPVKNRSVPRIGTYCRIQQKRGRSDDEREVSGEEYAQNRIEETLVENGKNLVFIQRKHALHTGTSSSGGKILPSRRGKNVSKIKNARAGIKKQGEIGKTGKRTARNVKNGYSAVKKSVKYIAKGVKAALRALKGLIRGIISSGRALIALIASSGATAAVIIILICMLALILGSSYGIFFAGESPGQNTLRNSVAKINGEYNARINELKSGGYVHVEISGERPIWKNVLTIYAVKANTDVKNPTEVFSMNREKEKLLRKIFMDMTDITYDVGYIKKTVTVKSRDEFGNIIEKQSQQTQKKLSIHLSNLSLASAAEKYRFTVAQKEIMKELSQKENDSLWAGVLYGIGGSDSDIVRVALSQVGNIGGEKYWRWYGFNRRAEWCACFVSWCANECGYIKEGIIPKYAGVGVGKQWFEDRNLWADNTIEPLPGMIVFFDWAFDGLDGKCDHTGIVQKVEDGKVYTVEGNSNDQCKIRSYPLGHYEIMGYGMPEYGK